MTFAFHDRLRRLRREKGVSQQVVADFCRISRSSVARYERGEQEAPGFVLRRLAKYFGVSVDWLLGPEEKL